MKKTVRGITFFFIGLLGFCIGGYGQHDSIYFSNEALLKGKNLFQTNCGACHHINRELIGPMLASITRKKPENWLINFISNSQQVIESGDLYANFIFNQYNRQVMPSFENLSVTEIRSILQYIEHNSKIAENDYADQAIQQDDWVSLSVLRGKRIFRDQCQTCHFIDHESYGPALGSVTKRRPKAWIVAFIHNSDSVIKSGDSYSRYLTARFNGEMVAMPFLTREKIQDILNYIEYASVGIKTPDNRIANEAFINVGENEKSAVNRTQYVILFIMILTLLVFIFLLHRLYRFLTRSAAC